MATGYEFLNGVANEGRVPASRNGKEGYLDSRGKVAIPFDFDFAGTFRDGLAPVSKGGRYGYIDTEGRIRIPLQFDAADEFRDGLAAVKIGKDSGFIDTRGAFVFHLDFDSASGFYPNEGVSRFWTSDGKFGYVRKTGKVIWGPAEEVPDHPPILGWSKESAAASCEGIPAPFRESIANLPAE